VFRFIPFLQKQRLKPRKFSKDVKSLGCCNESHQALFWCAQDGAKVVIAGRGYMKEWLRFQVQIIVEDRIPAAVSARLEEIP